MVRPIEKNLENISINPKTLEFHLERDTFQSIQSTDCDRRSLCLGLDEVEEELPDLGADSHQQETEEREKNHVEETSV